MKPTFFVFLFILILAISFQLSVVSKTKAQTVTIGATVDPHLTYRQDGQNLIISTNKPEGFVLQTQNGLIIKKGPVVLTVPDVDEFTLIGGY